MESMVSNASQKSLNEDSDLREDISRSEEFVLNSPNGARRHRNDKEMECAPPLNLSTGRQFSQTFEDFHSSPVANLPVVSTKSGVRLFGENDTFHLAPGPSSLCMSFNCNRLVPNNPDRVFVWYLDETTIILNSLLNGDYAKKFGKDIPSCVSLGLAMEKMIERLANDRLFYSELEGFNQMNLEDSNSNEFAFAVDGLLSSAFSSSSAELASAESVCCQRQDKAERLVQKFRQIRENFNSNRTNVGGKEVSFKRIFSRFGDKCTFIVVGQDDELAPKQMCWPFWRISSHADIAALYHALNLGYFLMTGKMVYVLHTFFKLLDVHDKDSLNDLQFYHLMRRLTTLPTQKIYQVFDMLDTDGSGGIDFDELYLLFCILVAQKDKEIKKFIHRHSRTVFDLLDTDGSNEVSVQEFAICGFLFNFHKAAINKIFKEFDCTGDEELDYREFRMFAMACIDKQKEMEITKKTVNGTQSGQENTLEAERRRTKQEAAVLKSKHSADADAAAAAAAASSAPGEEVIIREPVETTDSKIGLLSDSENKGAEEKKKKKEKDA